jgi:hypothetical protein
MRQMMKDMPQKIAEMQAKAQQTTGQNQAAPQYTITSDTKVTDPGASKVVNGLLAQERIITVTTKATMVNPPANSAMTSMTYVTTTEVWFAPEPPEMKEIDDFDTRMYSKLSQGLDMKAIAEQMQAVAKNAGMGMMFGNQPGAASAMAEMNKEIAKVHGIRVLEITSMSSNGLPAMPATAPGAAAPPPPSGGAVAGQIATDTASQTAAGESGKLGVFGNALSNSALSAFRRKKTTPPPAAAPASAPAAGAVTPGTAGDSSVLMSSTTQKTNFSRDPVPASAFQIPAGYKLVELPNGMF